MPLDALIQPPAPPQGEMPVAVLRSRFKEGKQTPLQHFREARPTATSAARLMRSLARHVDAALAQLWHQCGLPAGGALVAVGGYGRGELFPYSDVDVLVLLPERDPQPEATQAAVSAFITACWDIGIEMGPPVRTLTECLSEARRDGTIRTAPRASRG